MKKARNERSWPRPRATGLLYLVFSFSFSDPETGISVSWLPPRPYPGIKKCPERRKAPLPNHRFRGLALFYQKSKNGWNFQNSIFSCWRIILAERLLEGNEDVARQRMSYCRGPLIPCSRAGIRVPYIAGRWRLSTQTKKPPEGHPEIGQLPGGCKASVVKFSSFLPGLSSRWTSSLSFSPPLSFLHRSLLCLR